MTGPQFPEIQGIRVLLNAHLVLMHCGLYFGFIYGEKRASILSSPFQNFSMNMFLQVDVFFLIAGFLLTWKLIDSTIHPIADTKKWITDRARRMCPGILIASLIGFILGDNNLTVVNIVKFLAFVGTSTGRYITYSLAASWSNTVDVWSGVFLILVLFVLQRLNRLDFKHLCLAVVVSLAPPLIYLLSSPDYHMLTIFYQHGLGFCIPISKFTQEFYLKYSNVHLDVDEFEPFYKATNALYLYPWTRWSVFVIGAALACVVKHRYQKDKKKYRATVVNWILLIISISIISLPMIVGPPPPDKFPQPGLFDEIFFGVVLRPVVTSCYAYLIYSILCVDNALTSAMSWFFSLSLWSLPAEASFLIYMIHLRIGFQLFIVFFAKEFEVSKERNYDIFMSGQLDWMTFKLFVMNYAVSFAISVVLLKWLGFGGKQLTAMQKKDASECATVKFVRI